MAETVAPQVNAQWVRDAVLSFVQRGYFDPVVRPRHISAIFMTITAAGRKAAEMLSAPCSDGGDRFVI
jgi:hypothetical protein